MLDLIKKPKDRAVTRRYARHAIMVPVSLKLNDTSLCTYTTTLAAGGAFILCEQPTRKTPDIDATIYLDGVAIPCTCRVIYRNYEGIGIQFTDMEREKKRTLHHYFKRRELPILSSHDDPGA